MKKLYIISFLLILSASNIFSQSGWNKIFFNNVYGLNLFVKQDNSRIYAFGSSKIYFKSTNSGDSWSQINYFDSIYTFLDGQFTSLNNGWLVGYNWDNTVGQIFKTTDGGNDWIKQNILSNSYCFTSLCFINENTGWIGTWDVPCKLYKTSNGGINWSEKQISASSQVRKIKFFDSNNGWLMKYSANTIEVTTNGGENWTSRTISSIPVSNNSFVDLDPQDMNNCWALVTGYNFPNSYSYYYRTTNGGINWDLKYTNIYSSQTNSSYFGNVEFQTLNNVFSNGNFNFLLRTTNNGDNWSTVNTGYTFRVSTQFHLSLNNMFISGGTNVAFGPAYNMILKTTNLGENWSIKSFNWDYSFYDIHFKDTRTGIVTCDSGIVFKTTDNGANWVKVIDNRNYRLRTMTFADQNTGLIFGNDSKILRTTNYGNNWNEIIPPANVTFGKFINPNTVYAIGNSAKLIKSTNTGINWNIVPVPLSDSFNCSSIDFINNNTGWLLSNRNWGWGYPINQYYRNNRLIKTTNGGSNWITVFDTTSVNYSGDNYVATRFFDSNTGWMLTGGASTPLLKIFKTTNGGNNWYSYVPDLSLNLNNLIMVDRNRGWAVGQTYYNGNIYSAVCKTTNAGLNWIFQFKEYDSNIRPAVYSIYTLNFDTAWFCGNKSNIYSTLNGGGFPIGIEPVKSLNPQSFSLHQNYPNPFNPVTKIMFDIPNQSSTKIIIYDLLGREVTTLVNEQLKPGTYEIEWDGTSYASGVYFYSLVTNEFVETKRMVLIK